MVWFIASALDWKYPFWASLVRKLKFDTWSNSNMKNSMVMFTLVHSKVSFYGKFV